MGMVFIMNFLRLTIDNLSEVDIIMKAATIEKVKKDSEDIDFSKGVLTYRCKKKYIVCN